MADTMNLDAELDATVRREQVLKSELAAGGGMPMNAPLFSTPQAGAVGGFLNPLAGAAAYPSPEYTGLAATTIADQSVVLFPPIASIDLNTTSSAAAVTGSALSASAFVPMTSIPAVQATQQSTNVSASLGAIPRRTPALTAVASSVAATSTVTTVSVSTAGSVAVSTGSIPSVSVQPPASRDPTPMSIAPYTFPPLLNPTPAPILTVNNNIPPVVPPIYINVPPQQAPVVQTNFDQNASLVTSTTLPKIEILPFDSDPKNYVGFITNFQINIEDKVFNNSQRLNYLIYYCEGESKNLIKHCILLGDRGYTKALEILKERYGNPTEIARGYIDSLVEGPVIKICDTKALVALSDEMLICETVLTSMGYVSDLNSAHTVEAIIARLPRQLGIKFAEKAYDLSQSHREPSFKDLREFVSRKAHVAMSRYGVVVNENASFVPYPRGSGRQQQNSTRSVLVNQECEPDDGDQDGEFCFGAEEARSIKCSKCNGDHFVVNCQEFKDMSCDNKVNFIRRNNMCFNCLCKGHRSADCKKPPQCGKCTTKHHALIHIDRPPSRGSVTVNQVSSANVDVKSGAKDVSVNNVNVQSHKVCLRILPVVVHGKDVEIETYALLDEGSQVTLCDGKLFEHLNLPSIESTLNVNTVNQTVKHDCKEVSFVVSSLDGENSVSINHAFAVTDLPVSLEGLPEAGMFNVYPHLKGVDVPRIECDSVQLLIGCHVPDAFRVLDERTGQNNEPIAKLSKLGWTILGPIGVADMEPVREFLHVCPPQVESEIEPVERLLTAECADSVVYDKKSVNVNDAIDSFRCAVKLRDRSCKYALIFVILLLSCYFCVVNFYAIQEKQEYCVVRQFCSSVNQLEAERIVDGPSRTQ